jgi:hypothetical protein
LFLCGVLLRRIFPYQEGNLRPAGSVEVWAQKKRQLQPKRYVKYRLRFIKKNIDKICLLNKIKKGVKNVL